jgi:hypothetical protein
MRAAVARCSLAMMVTLLTARQASGQQADTVKPVSLIDAFAVVRGLSVEGLRESVRKLLADPDVLNSVLETAVNANRRPPLLENLKIRFATFEAAESDASGLGLNYSYSYSLKRQHFSTGVSRATGLDFRINATGNVAFERELNPRDFLKTDLALSFFSSSGGASATPRQTQARLAALRDTLALIESEEELEQSPLMAEYVRLVMSHLTTQRYFDFAVTGGLESDQSFQQKSYVYGGRVALDIKAWNPQSTLAQWNLFDWPLAAVRRVNGTDTTWAPVGSTLPTLLAGVAFVDPQEDDEREALGATDTYPRFNFEAAFRTLVLRSPVGPLYFQSDLRWYQEINPPDAIRQAGLDKYSYVALALVSDQGPYVSYTKGRLPVDSRKDEVYELGFKLYF